jgi:hypothetical protein
VSDRPHRIDSGPHRDTPSAIGQQGEYDRQRGARYEHKYPHNWYFEHEPLPHHNDRGSCALCLTPIRRAE